MSLDRKLLDNFLPEGFETQNLDGYKKNFDADRIRTGFDKDTLEILNGPNLNNFLDKTGKNFNILQEVMQFLKDMPIGCFPFINASNQLDYKNVSSFFRNVGEIVYSSVPLDDDNLHLADGSIIEGNGKYRRFVKYMVDLMNDYPSLFVTNEVYNTTVNKYGVCGKYVYNAQANTLRLPTYTGIMEATLDSSSLGNVVEAGLPAIDHTHTGTTNTESNTHTHTRGTMNITGNTGSSPGLNFPAPTGAFYKSDVYAWSGHDGGVGGYAAGFDASHSWTGSTSTESQKHTHTFTTDPNTGTSNPAFGRLQPGAKNQVQPQTVKVYPYVVLSIDESQKQQLTAVYVYQGSVPTKDDLPKEGNVLGHVYNVEYDGFMYGQNYAWNGEDWDPLGGIVDLSKYFTKIEISNQFATKLNLESNVEYLQGQISQNRADINTLDAGGVISKTPSKLKAATLLATVMDKPQIDDDIFNILNTQKRSTFDKSKFTVVGSPTITDDGVASGFSNENYLTIPKEIINSLISHKWKIEYELKTKPVADGTALRYLFGIDYVHNKTNPINLGFFNSSYNWFANLLLSDGSRTINFHNTLSNTNFGSMKGYLEFTGSLYINAILQETDTSWKISQVSSELSIAEATEDLRIGYNLTSGSIDLKQFSITVDGVEVFSGNKTGLDVIKPDNYEVVGSPVISEDGVVSGFSHSNYVNAKVSFNQNNKVRIRFSGIYTENTSTQVLFSFFTTRLESSNSNCSLRWNNIWIIGTSFSEQIKTGDNVDVDLIIDNIGGHRLKVYKNGILIGNAVSTTQVAEVNIVNLRVGDYQQSDGYYWQGSIDLNSFKIYVDGNLVDQPCLKIPYTESKTGSKIVDAVYRDRVIDLYEQTGYTHYYTIGENNFTLATCKGSDVIAQGEADGIAYTKTADLTLTQRGNCTSGSVVNLLPYKDENSYHVSAPYTAKTSNSFTPSADGDFIAVGKCYL